MGNRLSKIYTRTGDDGSTGLGRRLARAKENLRVEAYGTVDEANSAIGVVLERCGAAAGNQRAVSPKCSTTFSILAASCAFPGIA